MHNLLSSTLEVIAKDSHLFCLLTNAELKRVAEYLERKHLKAGEILFREGDPFGQRRFQELRGLTGGKCSRAEW